VRWTRQRQARNVMQGRSKDLWAIKRRADERRCSVRRSRVVL